MAKSSTSKQTKSVKAHPTKAKQAPAATAPVATPSTKLDKLITALRAPSGATIPDLMELTGWQSHSVRGALSGALKKQRGLTVTSNFKNGQRVYRIGGRA